MIPVREDMHVIVTGAFTIEEHCQIRLLVFCKYPNTDESQNASLRI